VAIALADVLEMTDQQEEAFDVLKTALELYVDGSKKTSPTPETSSSSPFLQTPSPGPDTLDFRDSMRAVAIALKLGDLAELLQRPEDEEPILGFAMTTSMRLVQSEYGLKRVGAKFEREPGTHSKLDSNEDKKNGSQSKENEEGRATLREVLSSGTEVDELGLPAWVTLTRTELAAPMERLGAFYARQGKLEYVIFLPSPSITRFQ
jgi:hypothetical protein